MLFFGKIGYERTPSESFSSFAFGLVIDGGSFENHPTKKRRVFLVKTEHDNIGKICPQKGTFVA